MTCRLCHGIKSVSKDGNGSYTWSRAPLDAPGVLVVRVADLGGQTRRRPVGRVETVVIHERHLAPALGDEAQALIDDPAVRAAAVATTARLRTQAGFDETFEAARLLHRQAFDAGEPQRVMEGFLAKQK